MTSSPRLYKALKTIWLFAHATILPGAVSFLVLAGYTDNVSTWEGFLIACGASIMVILWLIGMALLIMYRFPLDLYSAARMVFMMILQFALLAFLGGSILLSLYSTFFTSFVIIFVILFAMIFLGVKMGKVIPKYWLFIIPGAASACALLFFLFQPILKNLMLMNILASAFFVLLMLSNVISGVMGIYRLTTLSKTSDAQKELDREWESWAPATIILLILSAATACALGGFLRTQL